MWVGVPLIVVNLRTGECSVIFNNPITQSDGAVEYTDCTSAERQDPTNRCPEYDTKQSDGEVPVILDLWGMWNTPSLLLLPGLLLLGVVAPDGTLSMC